MNDNDSISIITPSNQKIDIKIMPSISVNKAFLLSNSRSTDTLRTIVKTIPIYYLENGQVVIEYSFEYFLLFANKNDYSKVSRTDNHDLISIVKNNFGRYYYSFCLYSHQIDSFLRVRSYKSLPNFKRKYYQYIKGKKVTKYSEAVQFEDGSILFFHERVKGVYEGSWAPDISTFTYLYEHSFI